MAASLPNGARRSFPSGGQEPGDAVLAERERILAEYWRREQELAPDLYAPWQPSAALELAARRRSSAAMLRRANLFPKAGDHCLEVGYGSIGWLGDLISWGVPAPCLHGVELNESRARHAQEALPLADLRIGDAAELPFQDDTFRLVIASTVFTSILDATVRSLVAQQIVRVLAPGGALVWYDFAINNPRNPNVRKVDRRELQQLFPQLKGEVRSVTLALPLARLVAPWSWTLATALEAIPLLRSHLLAVLVKSS